MYLFKKIAARLPHGIQSELKRFYFARQIKKGRFITDEPEYKILDRLVNPGDWVLDIGANYGCYTKRLSELVGPQGRVCAFEPVPTTFSLLSANVQLFKYSNVTLINAAASDKLDIAGISLPEFSTGLPNYYQAHLLPGKDTSLSVLTMAIDAFSIEQRISLVKMDVEGHEKIALKGMSKIIKESRPVLILETSSKDIINDFTASGYKAEKLDGSPNILLKPRELVT